MGIFVIGVICLCIYGTGEWIDYEVKTDQAISKQQLQNPNISQTHVLMKTNNYNTSQKLTTKDLCEPTSPYWMQYLQRTTLKGNITISMAKESKYYQYNVKLDFIDRIHIKEYHLNQLSNGGSSFRVLIENTSQITLCDVIDYFNGSYVAQCHLGETCYNVSVVLSYTRFVAYSAKIPSVLRRLIWNHTYCPVISHAKPHIIRKAPECSIDPEGRVSWYKEHGRNWTIVVDQCKVDISDSTFFKSCIQTFSSITFIGDSHNRFNYYYVLYKLGLLNNHLPRTLWGDHNTGNIYFKGVRYAESSAKGINETVKQFGSLPGKHVVIVNGGIWDLRDRGIVNFMNAFSSIMSAVIELKKTKLRLIWLSSVSYPENINPDGRSNPGIGAINCWVNCQLKSLGVEVFDISFSASNIRNEDNVCHHHYLCKDTDTSSEIYGPVGEEIVHSLITYICQPFRSN